MGQDMTGVYLYHENEELLNTETADSGYLEIIDRIKADGGTQAGTYAYENPPHILHRLAQIAADIMYRLRDHADFILSAVKPLQLLVGGKA